MLNIDYHTHSTYSDGSEMVDMVEGAAEAGLDGIGFADHCNVSEGERWADLPYDFDETYQLRRREIEALRDQSDLRLFDAVEMDYQPDDEDRIEAFLDEAGFEYAIGSVHHVGTQSVMLPGAFDDVSDAERAAFVDDYFELVIDLIESELFDIVAHIDLVERNEGLRGYATEAHYRAVTAALESSQAVPELNAGRAFRGYREVHPHPEFLDVLQEGDIQFVTGTDAHTPEDIGERMEFLDDIVEKRDIETVELPVQ